MAELYRSDIVDVDIGKSLLRTYAGIILNTGDCKANRFGANIIRAGEPVDISRCAVVAYFMRPNTETVLITGVVEGNTAYVDLPAACYTQEGTFSLALKVSSTDITQTVRVIDGCIRLTHTDTVIDPGDVIPSLDELFAKIADMEAATAEATAAAADAQKAAEENEQRTTDAIAQVHAALSTALDGVSDALADAAPSIRVRTTGDVVEITDAAARPAQSVVLQIAAVQAGEGDPSPDNVRPISGWDTATIANATTANLLPFPYKNTESETGGGKFVVNADGSITASGTPTEYSYIALYVGSVIGKGIVTAGIIGAMKNAEAQIRLSKDDQTFVTAATVNLDDYAGIPDVLMTVFVRRKANNVAMSGTGFPMLVFGDKLPTAYEAYTNPAVLTEALPETVYGGSLNWNTGILTVDTIKATAEDITYFGTKIGDNKTYWVTMEKAAVPGNNVICSHLYGNPYSANNGVWVNSGKAIIMRNDALTTVEAWKAWLVNENVEFVYKIDVPYTIQLSPQQLDLLRGYNAIWSDSGRTSVLYIADTKLYIDSKFDALQNAILAQGADI